MSFISAVFSYKEDFYRARIMDVFSGKNVVAISGGDLDIYLVSSLTIGDKLIVEINGISVFNSYNCPLVSDFPWVVTGNNPPVDRCKPTDKNTLILSNVACSHLLVLHYSNILKLGNKQPVVFQESNSFLSSDSSVYVVLQFISHYIFARNLNDKLGFYDKFEADIIFSNPDFRRIIFKNWTILFKAFSSYGWDNKSIFRMSLRAGVSPQVIRAFVEEDIDFINRLSNKILGQIHEAIYWLPVYLDQSIICVQNLDKPYYIT